MKNNPKVSIVVTNFNNDPFISDCLHSAINQSYRNLEILVVDDHSTDNSVSIIQQIAHADPRIRLIQNEQNIGYLRSFNKALDQCGGDLITFIDGDDWISHDKVEQQVRAFTSDPDLGCCGTAFARTDPAGRSSEVIAYPSDNDAIQNLLAFSAEVCFCGSSVMVRKEVIQTIGGYREFFIGSPAEDYDWLRRIANRFKMANLQEPLYMYRYSPKSLSANVQESVIPYFAPYIAMFLDRQRHGSGGEDGLSANDNAAIFHDFLADLPGLYKGKMPQVLTKRIVGLAMRRTTRDLPEALRSLWNLSPATAIKASCAFLAIYWLPISFLLRIKRYAKSMKGNDPAVIELMEKHLKPRVDGMASSTARSVPGT